MIENNYKPFRGLDSDFMDALTKGQLHPILQFEKKRRRYFMVEIRDNFLNLYFLGHGIAVKRRRKSEYFLTGSGTFNPASILSEELREIVKERKSGGWEIIFDDIKKKSANTFEKILTATLLKIIEHRKGDISEGVSEVNHFIDNRAIGKNGILIIDRQVVYPKTREGRIDLLGLRRLQNGKFTFVVLELKNKNNREIGYVFSHQVKPYIDTVYNHYEHFRVTYEKVIKQKIKLGLLRRISCEIAPGVSKKDIQGIVILDNYNIKSDLKDDGLLHRALDDWVKLGDDYSAQLFLKTNVLDSAFFMDYGEAEELLLKFKKGN
jgi:hypothetical protein